MSRRRAALRPLGLLVVLVIMVSILVGCGKSQTQTPQGTNQQTNQQTTQETFKFRFGHVNAPGSMVYFYSEEFAKQVKELSKGRIEITLYPNATLGNEARLLELVNSGNLDFAATTAMGLGSYAPAVSVLDSAFAFRDPKHQLAFALSDEGKKIFDPVVQKTNMMVVSNPSYGVRHLTTRDKEVRTPADLKGLKIRSMDFRQAVENVTSLGGAATPMAFSELYMGLKQKAVDGQENPLNTIVASKFYEVQKYLILTSHVVTNGPIVMSKKSFESLPKDLQSAVLEAGRQTMQKTLAEIEQKEGDWLKDLESKGMVVIKPDMEAFRRRAIEYLPPKMEDVWGKGVYEKIANFK